MKQKFRRHLLEFFAFCSVLAIAFGLARPLLHRIDLQLALYAQNIYELFENETGLTIQYNSISPSIFKHLKITGIEIKNKETNTVLFYAKNIILKYDIAFLFKKDIPSALKEISISNGKVHFQKDTDLELFKKITQKNSTDSKASISIDDFDAIIKLNNIEFVYSDSAMQASLFLKEVTAFINDANIELDLYSYADFTINNVAPLKDLTCSLSSHLSFDLLAEQGNLYLQIKNFDSSLFAVDTLAFVISFDDSKLQIDSIQHLQPFDIHANVDLNQPNLNLSLFTENFKPFQWIQLKNKKLLPAGFEHLAVTTNSELSWDQKDGLAYESQLYCTLPKKLYGGGHIDCNIRGNTHSIEILDASIESYYGNLYLDGNFDFLSKQLDAFASVSNFKINQGPEAFFDMYAFGNTSYIDLIIPELRIADSFWYSLELVLNPNKDIFDFEFTAMDTSGLISLEGSYVHGAKPFIQLHGGLDSVDVENTLTALLYVPGISNQVSSIKNETKNYLITTEVYFSSDFSHISYSIPRLILASIVQDGNFLLLTADGTESGITLSDVYVNASNFEITGSIISDFSSKKDISLQCSLFFNSLPYEISVFFVDKDIFFYGSYGITGSLLFDDFGGISGRVSARGFPIPIKDVVLSLDFDSELTFLSSSEWKITLETVQLEELSSFLPQKTSFLLSGYINPYGAFFENVQIFDEISLVNGNGFLTIESIKKSLQRFYFELELASFSSNEAYSIQGNFLKDSDIFFDAQVMCNNIPLSRFIKGQTNNNTASFSGTISGTPESIFSTVLVSNISYRLSGNDSQIHGLFLFEDNMFHFEDVYFSWKGAIVSELSGDFDPLTFTGLVQGKAIKIIEKKELQTNIMVKLESLNKISSDSDPVFLKIPPSFSLELNLVNIKWGSLLIKDTLPLFLQRNANYTNITIGKNNEIAGSFYDTGYIFFEASEYSPLNFILDGYIADNNLNIDVKKIALDLSIFNALPIIDFISVKSGVLSGTFEVSGLLSDPDFTGHLTVKDISLELPTIFSETIKPFNFEILGSGKQLVIPEFQISIGKGIGEASAFVDFDRWFPSQLTAKANIQKQNAIPVDVRVNQFRVKSNVNGNANLVLNDLGLQVDGAILVEKGFLAANTQASDDIQYKEKINNFPFFLDVSIGIGKKMEFRFPNDALPVIRGLIIAENPVLLLYDSTTGNYSLKGNASFRGGELFYLKRNFYLREGKISFNENQAIFNPVITLRAEIRERDSKGDSVRIILSVENQPLLSFSPHFTSDPIRSEAEILALLGQITTADANSDTVLLDSVIVASDILTQIGIFRMAENTIRDFLNLDIFSLRTLVIQNALFSSSFNQENNTQKHFSNYFDNTTVYMGKYFGSAIYTDLLAHFYYKNPSNQNVVDEIYEQEEGKLVIQPEIGIEINTPLFLFRWGLSPSNPKTLFVSDNALTFSWKFSY